MNGPSHKTPTAARKVLPSQTDSCYLAVSTLMSLFPLKPPHKPVLASYAALAQFHQDGHTTEGNTRPAFAAPLTKSASPYDPPPLQQHPSHRTPQHSPPPPPAPAQ